MPSMSKWMVGLALVGLCGCASDKTVKKPSEPAKAEAPAPEPIRPPPASGEKVTEKDTNGDKTADVWVYVVAERMVRKELDINWDGRVDITPFYDAREEREREAMDLDFDGKVDSVYFYEKGINTRRERDLNGDGRPDVWVYYEKGRLARKERDSNGDSRVDYWEYWENEQVDRVGEDLDGDGKVDRWTRRQKDN